MFRSGTSRPLAAVALSLAFSGTTPVLATETLFFETFEDGDTDRWQTFGSTGPERVELSGNHTLHLSEGESALVSVSAAGMQRVRVAAAYAAEGLGEDSMCVAEVSADNGNSWWPVVRVVEEQADAVTLHRNAVWRELGEAPDELRLRAWIAGDAAGAACWLDNVSVLGVPRESRPARRIITRDFLMGESPLDEPANMREFAEPADARAPESLFSGLLKLRNVAQAGSFRVVTDPWNRVGEIGEPIRHLPEFDFEFVQRGGDILPMRRDTVRTEHPYWEWILLPGKAWQEDDEWSRASVPFALQERSANCTHNGVMTWLFNDRGEVSRVAYQVASETCGYFKFDMWGVVEAEYRRAGADTKATAGFARLDEHRSKRLPLRPLSDLANTFPRVDTYGVGVDDGIDPEDMTVYGFVVNGVHYRSDCRTRRGPHPFCDSLPLPSYSTAKSIFAGIATMRLERMHPRTSRRTVASLIDQCDSRRWRDVSVEDALDMATGNFRSLASEEDENSVPHERFVFADNHSDKLSFACDFFPRKAEPGTRFVYHTSDTYIVGTALQALLREKHADADLYQMLRDDIWRPLGLSPLLDVTKRTYDAAGQPFTGYGLTYEADDIARIAAWLHNDNGRLGNSQVLDLGLLDAALQRDPDDRGLTAGSELLRYNNGFWAFDAGPSLGCLQPVRVPFMSGVSGITVAMFPNGVIYYYFSDSYVFRWQSAREIAHEIEPLC